MQDQHDDALVQPAAVTSIDDEARPVELDARELRAVAGGPLIVNG